LNKDRVVAALEDGFHRQQVGAADVFQGGDERALVVRLLVPPAVSGGEESADVHLVDRGVELHPREPGGEGGGIRVEQLGKLGVLKVADPVRQAEVAEVDDGDDLATVEVGEGRVCEGPVVAAGAEKRLIDRWAVTQERDAQFLDFVEVGGPLVVVTAGLHLVDADAAVVDGGIAVLDAGGEEHSLAHGPGVGRGRRAGRGVRVR
jgi:hypothetical protein